MATVKTHHNQSAKEVQNYLIDKRERDELTTEHLCFLEDVTKDFTSVQKMHNTKGNNAIHLIQSWSPAESKTLTPEKIHEMGLELANRFASGHQYVVQTHTDQPHHHNHILLNPVNLETGKRIQNRLGHLETLRNINDDIARENGLSVLPRQDKLRRPGPSEHVQRINKFRGRSYIVDLVNKGDFARHHATNYDEYVSLLNAFDINVRIEPQNITYFYPGREHGKRGKRLGPALDKPGLEAKFQSNLEKYQTSPDLKKTLSELVALNRNVPEAGKTQEPITKPAAPLVSSRSEGITQPRSEELLQSLIPIEEIHKAKMQSILGYCQREKIDLTRNEQGQTVLTGREYVEVSDYSWTNHKNKTRGNAIDFVAHHRQTGYLNAVSILTQNPRLMLLEQHLGELKRPYQSFHVPRGEEAPRSQALGDLVKLLSHPKEHPVYNELFKRQGVHVAKSHSIFLYPESNPTGYLEYALDQHGNYKTIKRHGDISAPLYQRRGQSDELQLFVDPKMFLRKHPDIYLSKSKQGSVLALLEPSLPLVHQAVSRQNIKRVRLVSDSYAAKDPKFLQFKNELTQSLDPFSIDVSMAWEPSPELFKESRGRELDLSREIPFHGI